MELVANPVGCVGMSAAKVKPMMLVSVRGGEEDKRCAILDADALLS